MNYPSSLSESEDEEVDIFRQALMKSCRDNNLELFTQLIREHAEEVRENLIRKPFSPIGGVIVNKPHFIQALIDLGFDVMPKEVVDRQYMTTLISRFTKPYNKKIWDHLIGIGMRPDILSVCNACLDLNIPLVRELVVEWHIIPDENGLMYLLGHPSCQLGSHTETIIVTEDIYIIVRTCIRYRSSMVHCVPPKMMIEILHNYWESDDGALITMLWSFTSVGDTESGVVDAVVRCMRYETKLTLTKSRDDVVRRIVLRNMDEV